MKPVGVFDILKIGVGPSSSHTLGPWQICRAFAQGLEDKGLLDNVHSVRVFLYGSLALTGQGHCTDIAIMMGLSGADPVTVPLEDVDNIPRLITSTGRLLLSAKRDVHFPPASAIVYHMSERLPMHANGMTLIAYDEQEQEVTQKTAYSIGGGAILWEEGEDVINEPSLGFPETGKDLLALCDHDGASVSISQAMLKLEEQLRPKAETKEGLRAIWRVMESAVFRGCHTIGVLPGGLEVGRRAAQLATKLMPNSYELDEKAWFEAIGACHKDFSHTLKWVGCFALAVNEENAALGRIVTSPTNGSAGVIPAVMMYYLYFTDQKVTQDDLIHFLLVAGAIGSIFKSGATISAAMGGCQAEIGVSSAMAAAALTEGLGGSPAQALMAAEIAMEHHLGMTCDPVGGLVQIPCIERNSMGAIKAITAAHIALNTEAANAKVSLDDVVRTMWQTAQDMNSRYKETSQGGLAVNISVRLPEC
ncbi:L-serine dehydratase TdcG [Marinomonas spartinae]|uniref:L-serine dehydratase n=1 Tax=Marinomonas spartinae TaxID=1792290 RepID=A0A1A8TRR1_9GAMM|nr:L-serine ammonia-lyase [Marinomonas spartinae]SBS31841.1 L-serine dehydratase TdcG [Marinomonas spartinae]SBS36825.1 L-serine dehydratase TdcG [Marinomonas spartinae]